MIENPYGVALLISATHFLFDWILQKRTWANEKNSSHKSLMMHVFTVSLGNLIAGILLFNDVRQILIFVIYNGIIHYIIDYISSRAYKMAPMGAPRINVVAIDQFLHFVTYITSLYICYGG